MQLSRNVRHFDGVDWYWLPSLFTALRFLWRERPTVVIFQWWTGTVLHSYLALALAARLTKATIVVEFHEVLDPGEDRLALVNRYVRLLAPWLFRLAHGFVVHSEFDRQLVQERYGASASTRAVAVIPLAAFDQYRAPAGEPLRTAPADCCNILFFGLIRPYKGLDDLVRVFDTMPPNEIEAYWLTVIGETWEGWTLPAEMMSRSPYRNRITVINRYVSDEEVARAFAGADVAVFPYHRSSQSGALHVALHFGMPVVITAVGGLVEAVSGYEGAVIVPPGDPEALRDGIRQARSLVGQRFAANNDWAATTAKYSAFIEQLSGEQSSAPGYSVSL